MDGSQQDLGGAKPPRAWLARIIYAALLIGLGIALGRTSVHDALRGHGLIVAVLATLNVSGYFATHRLHARLGRVFDISVALAIVGLVAAGPLGAFAVALAPDLVHLARRRGAFWNLGLCANVVSWAALGLVGAAVLGSAHGGSAATYGLRLMAAGLAMTVANYVFARLLLGVVRDRERALPLVRREFVALLPLELAGVISGVVCALALEPFGICALLGFMALAYLPQLAAAQLLRAPSVAALPIDDAATVYRDAIADEMRLSRADRRLVHLVDALAQRRQLPDAPGNPLAAVQDALLVTICSSRAPTQRHFSATTRTQVVLVARRWAQLTARCTPALNHREALEELHRSGLVHDAPRALAAAARIVEREAALTEHIAGVPRLHRAPLPRTLRHDVLPVALGRLAA